MNISKLLENGQQVQIVISAVDLKEAFLEWENERYKKMSDEDSFLTTDEAAKMLCKSKMTLFRWVKKGMLKAYRTGNTVRYRKSEVLKILNQYIHG